MFNLKYKFVNYFNKFKLYPAPCSKYKNNVTVQAIAKNQAKDIGTQFGLIGLKPLVVVLSETIVDTAAIDYLIIRRGEKKIARIDLQAFQLGINKYCTYRINGSENYTRNFLQTTADLLLIAIKNKIQQKKQFEMAPRQIQHLFNFCMYPRPVYLLSGFASGEQQCFPLDAIAVFDNTTAFFSIRKTNRFHQLIMQNKRVLLSYAPFNRKNEVYFLGKNNNAFDKPLDADNFTTFKGLLYPGFCSQVMELGVDDVYTIGSHYSYKCRIVSEQGAEHEQLAHVPWFETNLFK